MADPQQPAATPKESPSSALSHLSGTVLEQRYQLGEVLGMGGMGAVFEATHLRLDRPVAIKILRPAYAGQDEYTRRFLREAKTSSKIRHRNVVEILDYGETDEGFVYSVMEFLVGQDLEHLLRAQPDGRLPWARACGLLVQVANGLKAAHGCGVIHRDIKPANCFLTEEDDEPLVKLIDFGIAKVEDVDQTQQITGTTDLLGTPSYIAPELVRTKTSASARSDIYSLGVLAYRMLTGHVPFSAQTAFEVLRKACFDPVPPLRDSVPDVPQAVEEFVFEMLAREPTERPLDMASVRLSLLELARESLGAEAVVIPVSSALSLDTEVTVPRLDGRELRETPALETSTEVRSTFGTAELRERSSAQVSATDRIALVSTPSPILSAIPSASNSPLQIRDSASIDIPRGRGTIWLGLAGITTIVVVGAVALPWILEGDDDSEPEQDLQNVVVSQDIEVPESPAAPTLRDVEIERGLKPPQDLAAKTSAPPASSTTADERELPSSPEPSNDSPGSVPPEPPQATKPSQVTKPSGPPSDARLVKRLKRKIKSKCSAVLGDGSITISFLIGNGGEPIGLNASPRGEAGRCATAQVKGTAFRPRDNTTPQKFTIE